VARSNRIYFIQNQEKLQVTLHDVDLLQSAQTR
jgi:hypothetical protein